MQGMMTNVYIMLLLLAKTFQIIFLYPVTVLSVLEIVFVPAELWRFRVANFANVQLQTIAKIQITETCFCLCLNTVLDFYFFHEQ